MSPPLELEEEKGKGFMLALPNGAKCVFECIFQRPKGVAIEGLVRMAVGNKGDCSRKGKKNKSNKERVV